MPYANIVKRAFQRHVEVRPDGSTITFNGHPEEREIPANGVRVVWHPEEVQVVTATFTQGMPSQEELDTSKWASLDRQRVNDLIKTLREARDKAFGKDA